MKPDVAVEVVEQQLEDFSLLHKLRSFDYSREAVLTICFILIIFLFAVTALVSRLYHKKVHSLGDEWFSKGEAAFQSGRVTIALDDYRNALVYSPNNSVFELHLAQALAVAGHLDEANSYLTNLSTESPGDGELNLELARIAVRKNQPVDAMRYYQSAIYGVWKSDPLVRRWNVRRELLEYLLGRGAVSEAQPEAIGLAQEVPAGDFDRQKLAGEFLLRAGLWDRARQEFQSVVKFNSHDPDALAGLATALFQLERYPEALVYFNRLPLEMRENPRFTQMINETTAIVDANPWGPNLSSAERARRTSDALTAAVARMSDCAKASGESLSEIPSTTEIPSVTDDQKFYATWQKFSRDWNERNLELHPDRIEAAMALVFQIEDATAKRCGEPKSGRDHALRVIEQLRERAS